MAKTQLKIPGTERQKIKEVNSAAENYVECRDERMRLTDREIEARDALIALMRKHKLDVYRDEDAAPPLLVLLVAGADRVKVRRADEEEEVGDTE